MKAKIGDFVNFQMGLGHRTFDGTGIIVSITACHYMIVSPPNSTWYILEHEITEIVSAACSEKDGES